jgi:uncharacterized protein (TIGR01370 family)
MARNWKFDSKKLASIDAPLEDGWPRPQEIAITGDGRIAGGSGADQLTGGSGSDILIGHGGADVLTGGGANDVLMGERTVARNASLAAVTDFAIIYNGQQGAPYTATGLRDTNHDLLVINPARIIQTATPDETLWQPTEINTIKSTGKLVLGYLNVAKINDYTSMWQAGWTTNNTASGANIPGQAPDFLREDGAAANTRLVDITKASWIAALHARIDELIDQNFDGMFLDDVLRYFVPFNVTLGVSARAMRDLIIDITAYARQQDPDFIVMGNGGPDLIAHTTNDGMAADPALAALFYGSLDAYLAESYFRDPGSGQENSYGIQQAIANYGTQGIALFAADQQVPAGQVAAVEQAADLAGFIPFAIIGPNYGFDSPRFVSTMGDATPGNDVLDGGTGNDVLIGGGGDDWYFVDTSGDVVREAAGQGYDRVSSATTFLLAAGLSIELLTTADNLGTGAINLTGNALAQYVYGNAGSNVLDGGGGGDVLVGLGGNDFFNVRATADRVVEAAGGGSDRIFAAASFTLEAGSEVELITTIDNLATTAINLTGNALAQYLYGNAGSNLLDGGGGGDVLVGLAGDDFFTIRNAADRAVEAAGQGFDRVLAGASFTLEAGSEVELFTTIDNLATTAIDLTGNAIDQYLYGNAGANRLDGKSGADVLTGFGGADNFAFTTALGAANIDRITDFVSAADKILLDDVVFAALGLGGLPAGAFVIGSQAQDGDDRIIYNSATGQLLYDADGSLAGAAVQFATLDAHPALVAGDFTVI